MRKIKYGKGKKEWKEKKIKKLGNIDKNFRNTEIFLSFEKQNNKGDKK